MGDWHVWLLAVLQGVTEFLPVSSSGHLVLGSALFGTGDEDLLLDVVLHGGTLGTVLAVYRHELWGIAKDCVGLLRGKGDEHGGATLGGLVLLASVPTALIGFGLKGAVEGVLRGPGWVGGLLLLNGLILWSTRGAATRKEHRIERNPEGEAPAKRWDVVGLNWKRALAVGVVQGVAVVPGISRSGSTIAAALWMGVRGEDAAKLSFLLSVPAVGGAVLLKIMREHREGKKGR